MILRSRTAGFAALIFALSTILGVAWFDYFRPITLVSDYRIYHDLATGLVNCHHFGFPERHTSEIVFCILAAIALHELARLAIRAIVRGRVRETAEDVLL